MEKPDSNEVRRPNPATYMEKNFLAKSILQNSVQQFIELICQAALGIKSLEKNPFERWEDEDPNSMHERENFYNAEAAQLFLDSLYGVEYPETEFLSIKRTIEERHLWPRLNLKDYDVTDTFLMSRIFFHNQRELIDSSLSYRCEYAFHGVPFYIKTLDKEEFSPVPFDDVEYTYISKRFENEDKYNNIRFPDWASKFYVKRSHLVAHEMFFAKDNLSNEEVKSLRKAFLHHIGFDDLAPSRESIKDYSGKHKTRLLGYLDAVIRRYYGPEYKESDRETWTRQATVVEWLMGEYGLTKNEAMSIDIVTRPDAARNK